MWYMKIKCVYVCFQPPGTCMRECNSMLSRTQAQPMSPVAYGHTVHRYRYHCHHPQSTEKFTHADEYLMMKPLQRC